MFLRKAQSARKEIKQILVKRIMISSNSFLYSLRLIHLLSQQQHRSMLDSRTANAGCCVFIIRDKMDSVIILNSKVGQQYGSLELQECVAKKARTQYNCLGTQQGYHLACVITRARLADDHTVAQSIERNYSSLMFRSELVLGSKMQSCHWRRWQILYKKSYKASAITHGTNSPNLPQRDMHYKKKNSAHSVVCYRMRPPRGVRQLDQSLSRHHHDTLVRAGLLKPGDK